MKEIKTPRLQLRLLSSDDAPFIFELVNTEGWLKFIGDRNVHNTTDAAGYIQRILNNSSVKYWVVKLKGTNIPVGLVTLIQRDYLAHPDIGFAFLPQYAGKGYAFEAADVVKKMIMDEKKHEAIMAVTVPGNENSIKLLIKLGLQFDRETEQNGEKLSVYCLYIRPA